MNANDETSEKEKKFDFGSFPEDTLFYDRRTEDRRSGRDRRDKDKDAGANATDRPPRVPTERRAKKERRRRVDPTTFEKQYSDDEMEFMNAMQRFKMRTGKSFPSYGEVLRIATELGYRKLVIDVLDDEPSNDMDGLTVTLTSD
jgi:hypothetical protein